METTAAACCTVTLALAVTPSISAVMLAVPFATDVTNPLLSTVATLVFDERNSGTSPVTVPPPGATAVAVNCNDVFSDGKLSDAGESSM
jgi:hypothetical protein